MSWDIAYDDGRLVLLNGEDTIIRHHKNVSEEFIVRVMSMMEEMDVPIEFTRGLKEIYFTHLKGNLDGYYDQGKIVVSCSRRHHDEVHRFLLHELAHHIDMKDACSEEMDIIREWKRMSGSFLMDHVDIEKENGAEEYFAIGFEMYYLGRSLDEHNALYRCVDALHSGSK